MRQLLLVLAISSFAAAPAPAAKAAKSAKTAAGPRLPTGAVRAASVAVTDFEEHLRGLKLEDDMRPWMKALAVVENYDTEIVRDGAQWVVRFFPTVTSLADGAVVKGGGGQYRIDPASYRIIDRTFWK